MTCVPSHRRHFHLNIYCLMPGLQLFVCILLSTFKANQHKKTCRRLSPHDLDLYTHILTKCSLNHIHNEQINCKAPWFHLTCAQKIKFCYMMLLERKVGTASQIFQISPQNQYHCVYHHLCHHVSEIPSF